MIQQSLSSSGLRSAAGLALWERKSSRERVWLAFVYVILIVVGVMMLLPLYWLVTSGLKPEADLFLYPPKWIPNPIIWDNYREASLGYITEGVHSDQATSGFNSLLYLRNTLIIVVANIVGGVTSSSLIAYALARMRFRWRNMLFYTVLGTMLLPKVAILIPLFITFRKLGWINTFLPLTVPYFFGDAYLIFFLRQFFLTIPPELEDAARIDGCSTFRIWWQIILPLSKAALATAAILTFMYHWNDFLLPLIYLQKADLRTLQLGVVVFSDPYEQRWGVMMAYSSILVMPCLLVFFLAQRLFIQGIVFTGVKG